MKHENVSTKFETNAKSTNNSEGRIQNTSAPVYDLEDRTLKFAKDVRVFVRLVQKDTANIEDCKQLVRSSGSIGANYIEANESLSKKDFIMRIKIARKEAKESIFWLQLINVSENQEAERVRLSREATELMKILSAIVRSSET
jgi:four helix bundle protein